MADIGDAAPSYWAYGLPFLYSLEQSLRSCLVRPKILKKFKIHHRIKSLDTYI
jgi:hypothetical protein